MKRTPLKRKTPLKSTGKPMKRTRMKQSSAKQRKKDSALPASREVVWRRSNGMCEARRSILCSRRMEHAHHIQLRSQGGSHDPDNLLACCHACHHEIHQYPAESYVLGQMKRGNK